MAKHKHASLMQQYAQDWAEFVEDAVDDVCFKPGLVLKQLNTINAAIAKSTGGDA